MIGNEGELRGSRGNQDGQVVGMIRNDGGK